MAKQGAGFTAVLQKLKDEQTGLAKVGLQRLSDLTGAELQQLEQAWPSIETKRRRAIIASLTELSEENFEFDFTAVMLLALTDPDPEVRVQGVEGLWESTDFKVADRLVALVQKDPAPQVREAAASALGQFVLASEIGKIDRLTSRRVQEALLARHRDPAEDPNVRRRALESLGYLCSDEVADLIEDAYASSNEKLRASAVFAMGRQCDTRWLDTILAEMDSDNPEMRFEAARAAGEIQDERALPKLQDLLSDTDKEVRNSAIIAIGEIGGPRAKRILQSCAKSDDESVRELAEEALSEAEFFEEPLRVHLADEGDHDEPEHIH